MTWTELAARAEQGGEITAEDRARIDEFLARDTAQQQMPWYLHAAVAVGAWFASGFLLAFLFAFLGKLGESAATCMTLGILGVAAATGLSRSSRGVFVRQCALAISVAGHVVFFIGIAEAKDHASFAGLALGSAILAAALYGLYTDPLHRFLSSGTALFFAAVWALYEADWRFVPDPRWLATWPVGYWWLQFSVLAHLAALVLIFGRPGAGLFLRPLGYALAVSLIALFLLPYLSLAGPHRYTRFAVILATLFAGGGWERARRERAVWLVMTLGLVALAFTSGSATLTAIFFLVLGYGSQDRTFLVFGTVMLPVFLTLHYYRMSDTLLHKSIYLALSGAVLLGLRFALTRLPSREEAAP